MSIADKLKTIAENEQKVFDAGVAAGIQTEYDRFWDSVQDKGARASYQRGFTGASWSDDVYNPKYPIQHFVATAPTDMFGYNSVITDTKVPIILSCTNISYMFRGASALVTIPHLEFINTITSATSTFASCKALQNITIVGNIGCDISFKESTKLTRDSLLSIFNALVDYSEDTGSTVHTVTIGDANFAKLTLDDLAVAENKGWVIA